MLGLPRDVTVQSADAAAPLSLPPELVATPAASAAAAEVRCPGNSLDTRSGSSPPASTTTAPQQYFLSNDDGKPPPPGSVPAEKDAPARSTPARHLQGFHGLRRTLPHRTTPGRAQSVKNYRLILPHSHRLPDTKSHSRKRVDIRFSVGGQKNLSNQLYFQYVILLCFGMPFAFTSPNQRAESNPTFAP